MSVVGMCGVFIPERFRNSCPKENILQERYGLSI
jgi:hypothetical protein